MPREPRLPERESTTLHALVTEAVCSCAAPPGRPDHVLRERLRTFERTALSVGLEVQTLQVIRSGRRLLGDHKILTVEA